MLSDEERIKVVEFFGNDLVKARLAIHLLETLPDDKKDVFISTFALKTEFGANDSISKDMILKCLEKIVKGTYTEQISLQTSSLRQKSNLQYLLPLLPQTNFHPISPPSCDRCGNTLYGKYYKLENKDLCRRCMRRIRIRRKMLAAKPDREIMEIVISAVKDLREAEKYDRQEEHIKTNLKKIKPLTSSVKGNRMMFFCFWVPLWLVVWCWDNAISFILYGVDFRPQVGKILHSKTNGKAVGGKAKKKKPKPFFRI